MQAIRPSVLYTFVLAFLAACSAHAAEQSLHVHGDRLFVDVVINGSKQQALLDSGAEMTLIDEGVALDLKLQLTGGETVKGSGGEEQVRFADGVTINAVGETLANRTVAVLDLQDLASRLVGRDFALILGRELFDAGRFAIDIESGTIASLDRSREPQGVKLTLTAGRGIESIPVTIDGRAVQADFDLGNGSEVMISSSFAREAGLLAPGKVVERKRGGGLGGAVERDIVLLPSLEVAGVRLENVRAAVDELPNAGEANIGVNVLRRFRMVVDFPQRAVWLQPR